MHGGATAHHDARLAVLIAHGVPRQRILVASEGASTTLQELEGVVRLLQGRDDPIILVTSPHHSRRVALTWQCVSRGRLQGILRTTYQSRAPREWWSCARSVREVLVEYLALLDLALGSPCARRMAATKRVR
jgi:DUF218 domain